MRNGNSVASGREALAVLRCARNAGDPYQLAILDMQMPEMDGLTLARTIKSDPALASIRLIMLTSMCQRISHKEMQDAGIAAYLVKPVKQKQLYQCLLRVIADETAAKAAPATTGEPAKANAHAAPLPKHYRLLLAEDNIVNQRHVVGLQ